MRWQDLSTGLVLAGRYARQALVHVRLRRAGAAIASTAVLVGENLVSGRVTVGEDTVIVSSMLDGRGGLTVGQHVLVSWATILTAGHDLDSPGFETTYGAVTIHDYAVIMTGAMIMPGVTVGRGAVVGAGAIVTRDVPELAIVAGSPARVLRQRRTVHDGLELRRTVGFAPKRLVELRERVRRVWRANGKAPAPSSTDTQHVPQHDAEPGTSPA